MLDAAAEKGVKVVSFTGGEPLLLLDELSMLIKYAGSSGIDYVRTGTNGFLFMNPDKQKSKDRITKAAEILADTPLRNFWISIDSAEPRMHEEMRGFPGAMAGIEKALPIFHDHGIYPSANLGINRNMGGSPIPNLPHGDKLKTHHLQTLYRRFRQAFRRFYGSVIDMGFTIVNTCYPMSLNEDAPGNRLKAVYGATSTDPIVDFSRQEKAVLFKSLKDTLPEFRAQIRIFSPRSSLHALCRQYGDPPQNPYPCRGGMDFFFISCEDGNTYPCGYRGLENLGRFWDLDIEGQQNGATCSRCDWECFRDPSELFGPLLNGPSHPIDLIRRIKRDRDFFRFWLEDLRYYRACGLFNGREPPDHTKISRF
jgi:hypothetical protein